MTSKKKTAARETRANIDRRGIKEPTYVTVNTKENLSTTS